MDKSSTRLRALEAENARLKAELQDLMEQVKRVEYNANKPSYLVEIYKKQREEIAKRVANITFDTERKHCNATKKYDDSKNVNENTEYCTNCSIQHCTSSNKKELLMKKPTEPQRSGKRSNNKLCKQQTASQLADLLEKEFQTSKALNRSLSVHNEDYSNIGIKTTDALSKSVWECRKSYCTDKCLTITDFDMNAKVESFLEYENQMVTPKPLPAPPKPIPAPPKAETSKPTKAKENYISKPHVNATSKIVGTSKPAVITHKKTISAKENAASKAGKTMKCIKQH